MTDDTRSKELTLPEDEPWMSHAFISKIAAQVNLPYRRPKDGTKEIIKRNGTLEVRYVCGADSLPYGKYPRLFELWACTMVKTGNKCFDTTTNTIDLGATFREFLELIGVQIGGRQLKSIKPQMERLFKCVYIISNNTESTSQGVNFTVAEKYQIDWLNPNRPHRRGKSAANWVQLSKGYVDILRDHPVPVDLKVISTLKKPMAIDIYWWLTKRVYNLHNPFTISWQQLFQQFGSDTKELWKFKQNFKEALGDVLDVYPVKATVGPQRMTVFPSATSVPTVAQTRAAEKQARLAQVHDSRGSASKDADPADTGHWQTFDASYEVFTTSGLFDITAAREHRDALVPREKCRYCHFDQRNEDHHGEAAEMSDVPLF